MSKWQEEKAERNRVSLARLIKALPRIFPSAVLSRALNRPFVPPTPRHAIDSYWRAHPIRADRRRTFQAGTAIHHGSAQKICPSLGAEFTTQKIFSTSSTFYFNP